MKLSDIFLLALGALIALFGLIMVLGGAMNEPENGLAGHLFFVFGIGVLPLFGGVALAVYAWRRASRRRREGLERTILGMARSAQGRVTAQEVAHATDLTLDEAKTKLDGLHLAGHCQMDFDDQGSVVYTFKA